MRLPVWKKAQKERKERKKLSVIRSTLLVILFILLAGVSGRVYGSLRRSLWNGKSRLTVVLNSAPVLLVSFDPKEQTLNVLSVPNNTYLETIHGYGFYQAGVIWQLAEQEGYDGEFVAESLQEYLGVPVDGWIGLVDESPIVFMGSGSTGGKETRSFLLNNLTKAARVGEGTNLTNWDLIRFWWGVRKTRFDKVTLVDLSEISAVSKITLPDGTPALEPDPLRLDQLIIRFFPDSRLREENLSLAFYNGTAHSGLAKKGARLLDNIGGRVMEVGDWEISGQECQVMSAEANLKKYTLQKIIRLFDCRYEGEMAGESQVEVVVILGENYWQKLMAN